MKAINKQEEQLKKIKDKKKTKNLLVEKIEKEKVKRGCVVKRQPKSHIDDF